LGSDAVTPVELAGPVCDVGFARAELLADGGQGPLRSQAQIQAERGKSFIALARLLFKRHCHTHPFGFTVNFRTNGGRRFRSPTASQIAFR
jgi:hypothetical protein